MSIQTAALEHSLNVIRRDILDEFQDLTVLFIVHEPGRRAEALMRREDEIREHPAGESLWAALKAKADAPDQTSTFGGLAAAIQERYFGLSKHWHFLGVLFVNSADIEEDEHIQFWIKHVAYSLCWPVLDLYKSIKAAPAKEPNTITELPQQDVAWLRTQMLADCFATMMMENTGEKNAIQRIIKRRCEMCLTPTPHFRPEDYPFPLALDATLLVYRDLKDAAPPKVGPIAHTIFMTREIGETYEDASLTQWVTFCRAAQEMIWAGQNKTEVLGAAVYSNEDPYIRSTAYIVAETLNTDPLPLKNTDFYNPFADEEANERLHLRRARNLFQDLIGRVAVDDDLGAMNMTIRLVNAELLEGNPAGWCALAIVRAYQAYKEHAADHAKGIEEANTAFKHHLKQTPWKDIMKLHQMLVMKRREGPKLSNEIALSVIRTHKDLIPLEDAFTFEA